MKLTDWYSGDQKPVRRGIYQRKDNGNFYYSFWDGNVWCVMHPILEVALSYVFLESFKKLPWRGIQGEQK